MECSSYKDVILNVIFFNFLNKKGAYIKTQKEDICGIFGGLLLVKS